MQARMTDTINRTTSPDPGNIPSLMLRHLLRAMDEQAGSLP